MRKPDPPGRIPWCSALPHAASGVESHDSDPVCELPNGTCLIPSPGPGFTTPSRSPPAHLCVAGVRKPDPKIYLNTCERIAVSPNNAVFLDDLGINLKPARELGMRTIKVVSEQQAIDDLAALTGFTFNV